MAYFKNTTGFNQQFRAGGRSVTVKPGATITLTGKEAEDHAVQFLLARGILQALDDGEGMSNVQTQADEAKAKAEANKIEVNKASEDTSKLVMVTQCAGQKKNGERCLNNVSVPMGEYSEDEPFFCSRHKNEDADQYEKVDGGWVKKAEQVESEPQAEEAEEVVEAETQPEELESAEPEAEEIAEEAEPEVEEEAEPETEAEAEAEDEAEPEAEEVSEDEGEAEAEPEAEEPAEKVEAEEPAISDDEIAAALAEAMAEEE